MALSAKIAGTKHLPLTGWSGQSDATVPRCHSSRRSNKALNFWVMVFNPIWLRCSPLTRIVNDIHHASQNETSGLGDVMLRVTEMFRLKWLAEYKSYLQKFQSQSYAKEELL